jgi:MFS family permease
MSEREGPTGPDEQVDPAAQEPTGDDPQPGTRWFTPGVASVGVASFGSDAGHELVTSLLPGFVTSTLHAGPAALGIIEGVSDALIGVSKLAGGALASDPRRRGRLVQGGYLVTGLATAAIGLTVALWQVAILRAVAWISRGIRSPARDTVLMSLVPRSAYGRASGVERAGDNLGALVGPLLASALVAAVGVRHAMLAAVFPGILAAIAISVAARQARAATTGPEATARLRLNLADLAAAGVPRALAPVAAFELGRLASTLLILRATGVLEHTGRSTTAAASLAILLYAWHNAAATAGALVGGHLTDRNGPRPVFAAGAVLYVLAYVLFAVGGDVWTLAAAFGLAGAGVGAAQTAQSAVVARMLPDGLRGNGYGLLGVVQSVGALGASAVGGILWAASTAATAFAWAGGWMVLALIILALSRTTPPTRSN